MYIWPKEIQQIIAEVLHAQNPITCLEKFKNYEPAKLSLSNFLHNDPIIDSIIDNQKQRECLCETVDLIELSTQLEHEFLNTIK